MPMSNWQGSKLGATRTGP